MASSFGLRSTPTVRSRFAAKGARSFQVRAAVASADPIVVKREGETILQTPDRIAPAPHAFASYPKYVVRPRCRAFDVGSLSRCQSRGRKGAKVSVFGGHSEPPRAAQSRTKTMTTTTTTTSPAHSPRDAPAPHLSLFLTFWFSYLFFLSRLSASHEKESTSTCVQMCTKYSALSTTASPLITEKKPKESKKKKPSPNHKQTSSPATPRTT